MEERHAMSSAPAHAQALTALQRQQDRIVSMMQRHRNMGIKAAVLRLLQQRMLVSKTHLFEPTHSVVGSTAVHVQMFDCACKSQ